MSNGFRTLNNIIAVFRDISTRHEQINAFGVGDDWEIAASAAQLHPVLWINPTAAQLPRGPGGYGAFSVSFTLKIFDLVDKDESNEEEVLSDTLEIIRDAVNEFNTHPYYIDGGFSIDGDVNITPFTEKFDEEVSGWETNITCIVPNHRSFCGSPIETIPGYSFTPNGCTIISTSCLEINQDICQTGDFTTSGDITASGTITGNTFYGDGSHLTGLPVSNLEQTLAVGNSSGAYNITMGTTTTIKSDNGGGQLDLDYSGFSDMIALTTDNGGFQGAFLFMDPTSMDIGSPTASISIGTGPVITTRADIFKSKTNYDNLTSGLRGIFNDGEIIYIDNRTASVTYNQGRYATPVVLAGQDAVVNSGIVNSVILGGHHLTASASNTAYIDNLNINTLGSGTSVNNLGIDANGNVVVGETPSPLWELDGTVVQLISTSPARTVTLPDASFVDGTFSIGADDTMIINGANVNSQFAVHTTTSGLQAEIEMHRHSSFVNRGATIYGARSRGVESAPVIVSDNDNLLDILGVGFDGTDYALSGGIYIEVDGTPGSNDMPGRIVFKTTPDGSQTPTEVMRLSSAQEILIATPNEVTSSDTYTDVVMKSDGTVMLNNLFYIGVNFEAVQDWNYVAPEAFKINSIDNPDSITYTLTVNTVAYTLGDPISLYDDVQISSVSAVGFLKLNSELV